VRKYKPREGIALPKKAPKTYYMKWDKDNFGLAWLPNSGGVCLVLRSDDGDEMFMEFNVSQVEKIIAMLSDSPWRVEMKK